MRRFNASTAAIAAGEGESQSNVLRGSETMKRARIVCCLCAAGLCLIWLGQAAAQDGAEETQWKKITVRGRVGYVMPNEVARSLGLPREDIPEEDNAATYYMKAANALPERNRQDEVLSEQYDAALEGPWGPEQEELHAWFQETAEARRLCRKAASMERCQFPIVSEEPGETSLFAVQLTHLWAMRRLARLTVMEGHLLESQGELKGALEAYLADLRTGGHLGKDHWFISGLLAIACQSMGRKAIGRCLARHDVSVDLLEHLSTSLAELEESLPDRSAWIAGERAMLIQGMSPDRLVAMAGPSSNEQQQAFVSSRAFRIFWPDRTFQKDVERYYDALYDLSEKPTWEAVAITRETSDGEFMRRHAKDWNVIFWILAPAFGRAQAYYARGVCDHSALRINVALRLYRADHGQYPDELAALVPQYLKGLPPDPFSGRGFHYRREDDGWILYSVGPDQDDDGGREAERRRLRENGDIAYRSHILEEEK